ncbi:MAG: pyridoxamine 5'-phosphate oxidase [Vicinamibacterales bacterium]
MTSISDLRREYASRALIESEAQDDALRQFDMWFEEAMSASLMEVNAMTLATVSPSGEPSARIVLLKAFDERGFVFFTNYESAKGRDLEANPKACLLFFWAELERQIRITGNVSRVSAEECVAYFHSRPFESQIGAWASHQSRVLPDRAALEAQYAVLLETHRGQEVPLPAYWGGYRVAPRQIEFWQGRESRLHDRLLYTRKDDGTWSRVRLAP